MNQKTEEEIYKEYISQKQECPVCGGCMEYAGGNLNSISILLIVNKYITY